MNKFNISMVTSATLLLSSGCVKPAPEVAQNAQTIYDNPTATTATTAATTTQGVVFEEPLYNPSAQDSSGNIYSGTTQDIGTVTTPATSGTVYNTGGVYTEAPQTTPTYGTTPSYGTASSTTYGGNDTTYPDPYGNGATTTTAPVYNNPYPTTTTNTQPVLDNYPATTPTATSSHHGATGGIELQVAALKDYYAAQEYKNRLSLAPGQSAYIKRGAMNKVIVTGISSLSEANRLKESRFPGAFIVKGGSLGGYTPSVQPNYDDTSSSGSYSVNNPYGVSSSSSSTSYHTGSGIGVQVGAFATRGKAQAVANSQSARYPAIVKKIGIYYKVILTGFSSRSAARAHAGRTNGFVVNY